MVLAGERVCRTAGNHNAGDVGGLALDGRPHPGLVAESQGKAWPNLRLQPVHPPPYRSLGKGTCAVKASELLDSTGAQDSPCLDADPDREAPCLTTAALLYLPESSDGGSRYSHYPPIVCYEHSHSSRRSVLRSNLRTATLAVILEIERT